MRRNTKGKRISSLPLVNRNGWNVEYQVWDSLKIKATTKKRQRKRKEIQTNEATIEKKKWLYFCPRLLFPSPPSPIDRKFYAFPSCILTPTLFRCHLCLLSHSLFPYSSFPTFWAVLQPQLLIALVSYSPSYSIVTISCTFPYPRPQTIVSQCENLVGGEEEKQKGMWCVACLCPFLATSQSSRHWQWWGGGRRVGPTLP